MTTVIKCGCYPGPPRSVRTWPTRYVRRKLRKPPLRRDGEAGQRRDRCAGL